MKGERKGERSGHRQDPVIPIVHQHITLMVKGKESMSITLTAKGKGYQACKTQTDSGQTGPDKHRPSPGGQRPSPSGTPTGTSRRVGSGQGDLPHTRETTSASRMHGNHKEQHLSHSLNRWKERPALQHRHAGISTGNEIYTLRGILSKEV